MKKQLLVLSAAAMVAAAAVPAMAETTLYGSARIGAFYDTNTPAYAVGAAKPGSTTDLDFRNQATSRVGVIASDGALGGKVELGLGGLAANQSGASVGSGGNTTVYTRLIYGTYKFDAGTLLVGQTYSPYWQNSDQVINEDNGNNGFGSIYDGRTPQIKFTLNNGAYLDLIRPGGSAAAYASSMTLIPKLAVGWDGKVGAATLGGGVAGQYYRNDVNAPIRKNVTSLLGYVHGKVPAGPVNIGFNFGVGQNLGEMGIGEGLAAMYNATDKKFEDNLTISALVTAGFKVSSTLTVNAGIGYVTTDGKLSTGKDFVNSDSKVSAYVNAPITLAKNVTVVPEVTYQDQLKKYDGSHETKDYIYGVKCQIDF
jgi:hypothetical protein